MKRRNSIIIIGILCIFEACANKSEKKVQNNNVEIIKETIKPIPTLKEKKVVKPKKNKLIKNSGMTIQDRINPPEEYIRTKEKKDSLGYFLRSYHLKPADAPLMLYDGTEKSNQSDHVGILDLDLSDRDLQQCADSVMRIYGEYFWNTKQYNRIKFHFTGGNNFLAEYTKWREGYRIQVNGENVSYQKIKGYDDSYECYRQFMELIFAYAGTISLETESVPIDNKEIQIGDIFLKAGSPGHVVMVVDMCKNKKGEKAFLIAQGYMPAQDFHLLKNNLHQADPWYYEKELMYPFYTPQYTFEEGSLRRVSY